MRQDDEGDGVARPVWDVPDEQIVRSSAGDGWHGVDVAEVLHPLDDFAVPPLDRHILVFNLGTPMDATERRSGHGARLAGGGVMVLPAGRERSWHLDRTGEVRHLHLYLDRAFLDEAAAAAEVPPERAEIVEAYGALDPLLDHLGLALLRELRSEASPDRLYVDTVNTLLAMHLVRRHTRAGPRTVLDARKLPLPLLRRAVDYIESHLADEVDLRSVAGAAGLSPYHFARLFKASTGSSVHRFVVRRRVQRAEQLLMRTDASVAAVAQEVGFASGSHLARHFRQVTGVAPSEARGPR